MAAKGGWPGSAAERGIQTKGQPESAKARTEMPVPKELGPKITEGTGERKIKREEPALVPVVGVLPLADQKNRFGPFSASHRGSFAPCP